MMRLLLITVGCFLFCGSVSDLLADQPHQTTGTQKAQWRHPIALVSVGDRIYTGNQKSGSISVLDAGEMQVLAEIPVGRKLSDLVVLKGSQRLAAVDEAAHQLILLEPEPAGVRVLKRVKVAKTPVSLAVDAEGDRVAVASLWSRRVSLFQIGSGGGNDSDLKRQAVIDLPFAPRKMLWVEKGKRLIVGDAFGGRLGILDADQARMVAVKHVAGHNIRGLAVSGDGQDLLIAQQVLNAESKTMRSPVFWGNLMQNVMRSQSLEELLSPETESANRGDLFRTEPLGHPSNATGDPYDVKVLPGGQTVVSLSGVGELAIRRSETQPFERFDAQARSTAILLHPDEKRVLVANTFADSITMFDLEDWGIAGHVSLGPTPPLDRLGQGERLFYDAKLSLDGWYSCHSCHTDGHTTGRRNDNLSDYSFGAPKRILSLGGVAKTGPWAWNGEAESLAGQTHSSITKTMQGEERSNQEIEALAEYLKTIEPAPSLDKMRGTLDAEAVQRGETIFRNQGCANCHQPPTYTSGETFDVGLADEQGGKQFNPPSLLGVSQRQELFHDSRAKSLYDVLKTFQHGEAHRLSNRKRADLIAFLRSL